MTDGCAKALGPQARADPSPLSRLTDSTPGPSSMAADLNSRPRKTLAWETPSRQLARLLASGQ
jgi:hypothetical protein